MSDIHDKLVREGLLANWLDGAGIRTCVSDGVPCGAIEIHDGAGVFQARMWLPRPPRTGGAEGSEERNQ